MEWYLLVKKPQQTRILAATPTGIRVASGGKAMVKPQ